MDEISTMLMVKMGLIGVTIVGVLTCVLNQITRQSKRVKKIKNIIKRLITFIKIEIELMKSKK